MKTAGMEVSLSQAKDSKIVRWVPGVRAGAWGRRHPPSASSRSPNPADPLVSGFQPSELSDSKFLQLLQPSDAGVALLSPQGPRADTPLQEGQLLQGSRPPPHAKGAL